MYNKNKNKELWFFIKQWTVAVENMSALYMSPSPSQDHGSTESSECKSQRQESECVTTSSSS